MRDSYISELIKEIRGPRYGTNEILTSNPYTEYVTGVIIPKSCKIVEPVPDSELIRPENDDTRNDDGEVGIDYTFSVPSELDPQMKPKSFGVSFMINGSAPEFDICISWARYKKIIDDKKTQTEKNPPPDKQVNWQRFPYLKIIHLNIQKNINEDIPIYEKDDGKIVINTRVISLEGNVRHIIISLVNDLKAVECKGEEITSASIFQPSIRINIKGESKLISAESEKKTILEYLYKDQPVLARGHMCSAVWKSVDFQEHLDPALIWPESECFTEAADFIHCDIRSEFIPLHPTPSPDFSWSEVGSDTSPIFSAYKLSEMWSVEEIDQYLTPLTVAYQKWIVENEAALEKGSYEKSKISADIIQSQKTELNRLKKGIDCIKQHEDARIAFCFANRVIWLQNLWKKRKSIQNSDNVDFPWRPFQLAFFLTCIESLYHKNSDYRDVLDLLWVPTGGGKTESYLAIMAFTIALRRRNSTTGTIDSIFNNSGGGVSIITRYTLRLLTVQQFRRTLLMILAAEYLRVVECKGKKGWRPQQCSIDNDWIYGEIRFSAGMWVGGAVSPNHLRGDDGAISALMTTPQKGEPAQIVKCPICGSWLSIPRAGLSEGNNIFYLIIHSEKDKKTLSVTLEKNQYPDFIKEIQLIESELPDHFFVLKIDLISSTKIQEIQFDQSIQTLEKNIGFNSVSFRPSRPGYFPVPAEPGRRTESFVDFEIYCPNPVCDLNKIGSWAEGTPCSGSDETIGSDGLFLRSPHTPFSGKKWMPIPAYTTDEQIYHRCPTVIISTADKIARLAFEPRAGSMFGAVSRYNRYYGFLRGDAEEFLPTQYVKGALQQRDTVVVKPFLPPDLIVQDELHLMDGPLGSMFGLYEAIVDGLIRHAGGRPKYIASSATVKRAEDQIELLFNRKTFQFPPNGLTYEDSFFIKFPNPEKAWDEQVPGKIYLGIYAPGMGPLTPIVRIWSRILKTGSDLQNEENINNFWTLVGFFNSVRELGGNRALYREDIVERLKYISDTSPRTLDAEKVIELSSRINSTDIPQILEDLEQGKMRPHNENPDVIFTTSMFGTGVDIPHLSLMVVNGQPKTTSQYIQATGRVGREHGALVAVFYKAGRPRDLSHYEIFMGYHNRINLSVEPASVAPFSRGCLDRAAGPAMVAFLRNMRKPVIHWESSNGHIIRTKDARKDLDEFLHVCLEKRGKNKSDAVEFLKSQFDMWEKCSRDIGSGVPLKFHEYTLFQRAMNHVVLGDPAHALKENLKTVFKNAPQSLRDIEETTSFEV